MNNFQNNQPKQSQPGSKPAEDFKGTVNRNAEQGARAAETAREGLAKMVDLQETAADTAKQIVRNGVEVASRHALDASNRLNDTLGFSGEDSERLARQSKQDVEAVTRCGTVLSQAFQDTSRNWFELGQKQLQRNLEGMNKLAQAKTVQEFATIQNELTREALQHMVQDSRGIAETMRNAVDEAGKAFSAPGRSQL